MIKKPLAITTIILVALFLGTLLLWLPKYQDLSLKLNELKVKKEELKNKKDYFAQLQEISDSFQQYQQEISRVEAALPSSPKIPDFLNFIEKIASQNGLILQSTKMTKAQSLQQPSNIFKVPLDLSLAGSYSAFKNFLSELQSSSRLIELEQLSFSTLDKGQIFKFDLRVRIHSY